MCSLQWGFLAKEGGMNRKLGVKSDQQSMGKGTLPALLTLFASFLFCKNF
jgi:hypothetical protein